MLISTNSMVQDLIDSDKKKRKRAKAFKKLRRRQLKAKEEADALKAKEEADALKATAVASEAKDSTTEQESKVARAATSTTPLPGGVNYSDSDASSSDTESEHEQTEGSDLAVNLLAGAHAVIEEHSLQQTTIATAEAELSADDSNASSDTD